MGGIMLAVGIPIAYLVMMGFVWNCTNSWKNWDCHSDDVAATRAFVSVFWPIMGPVLLGNFLARKLVFRDYDGGKGGSDTQ